MRLVIKHLFAVATILLLEWLPLSAETTSTISHYIPSKEWNSSTPEEQGMDSKILADAVEYILEHDTNVHSMTIIRNGYSVLDAIYYPYQTDTKHDIASATKSIMSTLIGIAIDSGFIQDVNQPVLSFFSDREISNVDSKKGSMTIEDLLTMRSGFEWGKQGDQYDLFRMMKSPDWVQFMLNLPVKDEPGIKFSYNSGAVHLLSDIIRVSTGMKASDFARQYLFEPLGITDVAWPDDFMGTNSIGWGNIRMIPGDLAKIGYLYLNNGKWEDQQIISPGWIRAATKKTVTRTKSNGYGYLWWIYKDNLYSALGRGGQFMYIYPDENMIVVFTGGGSDYSPAKKKMIRNYIIPAIVESNGPIPNSPDNTRILEQCIQRAGSAPVYHPEHFEPSAIADRISGIEYNLEPNKFGIESFVITAESENEAIIKMNLSLDSDRNPEYRIGLDNVPRFSEGRFGIPATAKGAWRSESTFTIWLNEIGNINCFRIEISFDNGRVRFDLYDKTGLGSASINGKVH